VTIIVGTLGGVFLLWAVWWIYRGTPTHSKHYTTVAPARVAAMTDPFGVTPHTVLLGKVGVSEQDLAKAMYEVRASGMHGADALDVLKSAALGADTRPAPRHTHRDPTTGRYTRKEQ